jgi:hypothetical protein
MTSNSDLTRSCAVASGKANEIIQSELGEHPLSRTEYVSLLETAISRLELSLQEQRALLAEEEAVRRADIRIPEDAANRCSFIWRWLMDKVDSKELELMAGPHGHFIQRMDPVMVDGEEVSPQISWCTPDKGFLIVRVPGKEGTGVRLMKRTFEFSNLHEGSKGKIGAWVVKVNGEKQRPDEKWMNGGIFPPSCKASLRPHTRSGDVETNLGGEPDSVLDELLKNISLHSQ